MTEKEVQEIFTEILKSTPGVHSIMNDVNDKSCLTFGVDEINNCWNFTATIKIIKNTSAKDIVKNITALLKYQLGRKKQNIGKINLFIGGLAND